MWSENPDWDDYGHIPYVYDSLVTLGDNWELATPEQRKDIEALATTIRAIGDDFRTGIRAWVFDSRFPNNLSPTERLLAIANPLAALKVDSTRAEAVEEFHSRYGWDTRTDIIDGSNGNAFLHCYWNALLSKEIGAYLAKLFTDAHEYGLANNYTWIDDNVGYSYAEINVAMDIFNNNVGINLGAYNKNQANWFIAGEVQKYVDNGWLLRIKVNGVIQNSTISTNGNYR